MRTRIYLFIFFISLSPMLAQEQANTAPLVDSLYREDQFYVGITFNLLLDRAPGVRQNNFSGGMQLGFIRDMPINKRRNKAIGVGLGWAFDTYNQNLFIGEDASESTIYSVIDTELDLKTNRFTVYQIEMPIEYRWRTSTPTNAGFWRIHLGARLGYAFGFNSKFIQRNPSNEVRQSDVPEFNRLQYGGTLSFGYGAFNVQGYFGLNTLFDNNARVNDNPVDLRVIRLGIQFLFL